MASQQPDNVPSPGQPTPLSEPPPAIDIRLLAERVYRLMVRDVRLARARGAAEHRKG